MVDFTKAWIVLAKDIPVAKRTTREALLDVLEVVRVSRIHGLRSQIEVAVDNVDRLGLEWERGAGIAVHLSVTFEYAPQASGTVLAKPIVGVSWPGGTHSVVDATACMSLFREVTDLAATCQARLDRMMIFLEPMLISGLAPT